jgi:hypothetical protein
MPNESTPPYEVSTIQPLSSSALVPVAEIKARMAAIRELVSAAMVKNVHFGSVTRDSTGKPGRPSLWKPGADLLLATFRIAVRYHIEDLSYANVVRYRVTAECYAPDGSVLGQGLGEASTQEEKYRWRRSVCKEEFDATPEDRRRVKFSHGKGGTIYTTPQIMTEAADSANTILKMAEKRARVDAAITITGCADSFTQDLDDDDGSGADEGAETAPTERQRPTAKQPNKPAATQAKSDDMAGERAWITQRAAELQVPVADILIVCDVKSLDEVTRENFPRIREHIRALGA